jgi:sulfonate transport system permease protein
VGAVAVPLLIFVIWEIMGRQSTRTASVTYPSLLWQALDLPLLGTLAVQTGYSLARLFVGSTIGALAGIATALFLWESGIARSLGAPTLRFIAPVPVVVWIPFFILLFGLGEWCKIAVVAMCVFFMVQAFMSGALTTISNDYFEVSRIYGKGVIQRIRHVLLPSSWPVAMHGVRISLALAWVALFLVECGFSRHRQEGLGWFIANAQIFGQLEKEFLGVIVLATVAFVADRLLHRWQLASSRWMDTPAELGVAR